MSKWQPYCDGPADAARLVERNGMPHPLADEDLRIVIDEEADSKRVTVTITHIPTGSTTAASGTDEQIVRQKALDDLLGQLETISG